MTRKWILSDGQYSVNKNIRFKISTRGSDFLDYNNAYIIAKGKISFEDTNDANKGYENLTFKNNSPLKSSISNISSTFIENAEDLDIVITIAWHHEVRGIIMEMN